MNDNMKVFDKVVDIDITRDPEKDYLFVDITYLKDFQYTRELLTPRMVIIDSPEGLSTTITEGKVISDISFSKAIMGCKYDENENILRCKVKKENNK